MQDSNWDEAVIRSAGLSASRDTRLFPTIRSPEFSGLESSPWDNASQ